MIGSRTLRVLAVSGAVLGASAALSLDAQASHFRGGALVPSVNANGLLTIESTTFWRPTFVSQAFPSVSGIGNAVQTSNTIDTSDSRFTVRRQTHTIQLPNAGTFDINWPGCCRVAGINNAAQSSWAMNSKIFWDGSTANTPILFDFAAIQPEVVRGATYNDNLGATSGNGQTLTYDQALNLNISSQPPGFQIDPNTGALSIPSANTAGYVDNTSNDGADYAFSGNIFNADGSQVEFDWLFDAVDTGSGNLAPDVNDLVVNALVGDLINETITATDPNTGDTVTLNLSNFFGPGVNLSPTFTPGASGNPTSGTFAWDTAG